DRPAEDRDHGLLRGRGARLRDRDRLRRLRREARRPRQTLRAAELLRPRISGPTPFAKGATPKIPRNVPPTFITCPGSGDRVHAIWADEYFSAMLKLGAPNLEMHIYGNGVHGGALKHRDGIPFGTWQDRFVDWVRAIRLLGKPGLETKAERDVTAFVSQPPLP